MPTTTDDYYSLLQGDMRLIGVMVGVLILGVCHAPGWPSSDYGFIAVAAAAAGNTGGQGITGRPQKNGTVKGSPKPNPSISGSQTRGKH
jgi:hypothetical protein